MFILTKFITAVILPPFNVILLWILALIFVLLRYKKLALFSSCLGLIMLYVASLTYTEQKLRNTLTVDQHFTIEDYRKAQAIVVLGGGLRDSQELFSNITLPGVVLERMRYAAYLHKETELPILISGASPNGNSEAKIMEQEFSTFFSIHPKWLEQQATTTKENAQFSAEILKREGISRIILVTNEWHIQRAALLFEKQGISVIPAAVGEGKTPDSYGLNIMHFIPQAGAMANNMQLAKEWIGYLKEKYLD